MSIYQAPVMNSDGECYVSIAMAAHSIIAKHGCGNLKTVITGLSSVVNGKQYTAYGKKWKKIDKCVGCKYIGMVGVCPIHWSWPKYPASVCKLKGGAQ